MCCFDGVCIVAARGFKNTDGHCLHAELVRF